MRPITPIILAMLFTCLESMNCSDNPLKFKSAEIEVSVFKNKLTIINHIDTPIYYFAVARETAARIMWTPISTDKNKVNPQRRVSVDFNDITGFQAGKQIIVYYWWVVNSEPPLIKSLVVDTE